MQFSQAVCICMSQVAVMKRVQVIYNENVSYNKFTFQFYKNNYYFIHQIYRTPCPLTLF